MLSHGRRKWRANCRWSFSRRGGGRAARGPSPATPGALAGDLAATRRRSAGRACSGPIRWRSCSTGAARWPGSRSRRQPRRDPHQRGRPGHPRRRCARRQAGMRLAPLTAETKALPAIRACLPRPASTIRSIYWRAPVPRLMRCVSTRSWPTKLWMRWWLSRLRRTGSSRQPRGRRGRGSQQPSGPAETGPHRHHGRVSGSEATQILHRRRIPNYAFPERVGEHVGSHVVAQAVAQRVRGRTILPLRRAWWTSISRPREWRSKPPRKDGWPPTRSRLC